MGEKTNEEKIQKIKDLVGEEEYKRMIEKYFGVSAKLRNLESELIVMRSRILKLENEAKKWSQ